MAGKAFDLGDGIFFFFKRFGEKPMAALWIAACQAGLVAVFAVGAFMVLGPFYIELFDLIAQDAQGTLNDADAERAILAMFGPYLAYMPLVVLGGVALALMFEGAWLRFLVRGHVTALIPFRFGADELRLLGVNLLYIVVGIAAYMGVMIAVVVVTLIGAGIVAGTDGSMAGGLLTGLFAFLGVLAIVAVVIVFATRLATAPALTIADRRVRFFESWTASKGVFWHLLLSYLVVFGIILVLTVTLGTVIQLMFLGSLMPVIVELSQLAEGKADLMPQDVIAMLQESLSSPGVLIGLGIGSLLAYLMRMTFEGMWHGVGAYNAVRYRADGAPEDNDAPVLGADHPAGASPTQD